MRSCFSPFVTMCVKRISALILSGLIVSGSCTADLPDATCILQVQHFTHDPPVALDEADDKKIKEHDSIGDARTDRPLDQSWEGGAWVEVSAENDELHTDETATAVVVDALKVMLQNAEHVDQLGNVIWKTSAKPECNSSQQVIYLPTVPRSGTHWIRLALEEASGIGTGSIFGFEECEKTHCECGLSEDCERVRYPYDVDNEPVLVKLHYPTVGPLKVFTPAVQKALITIRNPFDNYLAWRRFNMERKMSNTYKGFRRFFGYWTNHFAEWFGKAQRECMQVTMFRFEDLVDHQREMLQHINDAVGWSDFSIDRAVLKFPASPKAVADHLYHNRSLLREHPSFGEYAQSFSASEKALLQLLGYGDFVAELASNV